jgi:threonine dehydratase
MSDTILDQTAVALRLLRTKFAATPLVHSLRLSEQHGVATYLKIESGLPTGSFKVRGAYYSLWTQHQREPVTEVVAASTGNHGAAVAWAARELGIKARVFVPVAANTAKTARIKSLGATLVETGADIEAARRAAEAHAAATGAMVLDDATSSEIPIGAATIGTEVMEQLPDCATIVVPVGDSALIRGVAAAAKAAKPNVDIIGVQAENAPAYYESWRSGRVVTTETANTIADGLATTTPTAYNVEAVRALVDEMTLVSEDAMIAAMRLLRETDDLIAEPSSAAAVAAIRSLKGRLAAPVVALITGGNVAPDVLMRYGPLQPSEG